MEKELTKNEKTKKEKKDIKKTLKSVLALALVAVISIAGTLAFLQKKAVPKNNVFLGSSGIDLTIQEPGFDANKSKAESYSPGSTITKDPYLVNTTNPDDYDEWVAMKVSYQKLTEITSEQYNNLNSDDKKNIYTYNNKYYQVDSLTYDEIKNVISPIVFNGDSKTELLDENDNSNKDWYLLDGGGNNDTYVIYMYKKKLEPKMGADTVSDSMMTEKLFKEVKILSPMKTYDGQAEIDNSDPTNFPKFRIDIEGAAVKDEGYTYVYGSDGSTAVTPAQSVTCIEQFSYKKDSSSTNEADLKTIQNELLKLLGSSKVIS